MIKRHYELSESDYCLTECPMDKELGINSIACRECKYNRGVNDVKNYVLCAWEVKK